ncbi:MAG: glycoside hydrolase family 130 protein [Acidimicrobiia bacterium]
MRPAGLVTRSPLRLVPDASRVVTRLFVPGNEPWSDNSRASGVVGRILGLDDDVVAAELAELMERFGPRHRDLGQTFARHAERVKDRIAPRAELSPGRRLLLGAAFTHEYSIEAAALCNPSMVALPSGPGTPSGSIRFAVSVRGIGEGHRSTIGFRHGLVDAEGIVTIDEPGPHPVLGTVGPAQLDRELFQAHLDRLGQDESASYVLERLGPCFSGDDLDHELTHLMSQRDTRHNAEGTARRMRRVAERSYTVSFGPGPALSERVLWPAMPAESNGMEDARFVRFVDDDQVRYLATYTAFDGSSITQQLLETADFSSFTVSPVAGPGAANKGLALFPRRVGGRYAALSRYDAERNAIAFSDSPHHWGTASVLESPRQPWEVLQLGNCGPPIETPAGWLVLTHGVGPMRTYSMGALLLDLDDPCQVIGQLASPLLAPSADEQDGYVPNVVYSCGALMHGGTLVIPYGIADASIGFATVPWADLHQALLARA